MTPVTSTAFKGYAYDPSTRSLTIEFHSGQRHIYDDVPMEKVAALEGNASPGRFFTTKIKGVHGSRKV